MIGAPGLSGVVFTERSDGDMKSTAGRERLAGTVDIDTNWATVAQVHGASVLHASSHGVLGDGDAMWTETPALPLAVFTADCLGVAVVSENAVGVAHAGWRGCEAGVVRHLVDAMILGGHRPYAAAIGPGIGPCCFEVGPEVVSLFTGHVRRTSEETPSVDLANAVREQLGPIPVTAIEACTRHEDRWFSHRADGTAKRLATVVWL